MTIQITPPNSPNGPDVPFADYYWRSRALVLTGATIRSDVYPIRECAIRVRAAQEYFEDPLSDQYSLIDVYLPGDGSQDIRDVFVRSHNMIDEFLDRVSLVSYSPASLIKFISTCPSQVEVGVEFAMATSEVRATQAPVKIIPPDIANFDDRHPLLVLSDHPTCWPDTPNSPAVSSARWT